jgi:predicted ATPase
MALAFDRPLVCPVLVGRDAWVDVLDRIVKDVQAGRGHALLISGAAGIGKSRLIVALGTRAAQNRCPSDSGKLFRARPVFTYAPLVDALHLL